MTALSPWSSVASPATRQIEGLRYRVDRFVVRVVAGPDRGASAEAHQAEVTVGTGEGNALRLTDPAISRHHCSFEATPDGARMRDLGSTNGTRIAGCLVEAALLSPGARVSIGNTELIVDSAPGGAQTP